MVNWSSPLRANWGCTVAFYRYTISAVTRHVRPLVPSLDGASARIVSCPQILVQSQGRQTPSSRNEVLVQHVLST